MPYDWDVTASDVVRKVVFHRSLSRMVSIPCEALRVKAEADAYRSLTTVRGLGERLELQYGSFMSSENAKDALQTRVDALERERHEMFVNEQKMKEELEELRKAAQELVDLKVDYEEARADLDMWKGKSKEYEDKYEELRMSFNTFERPDPLLMHHRLMVSDEVMGRCADEILNDWDRGFADCKRLVRSTFPELDLTDIELDEPYPEEGEASDPAPSEVPAAPADDAPADPAPHSEDAPSAAADPAPKTDS